MSRINDADLDRLADYAAGLLDPQEHRQVDELIRTDPTWRQAHRALADAQPRLDAGLAELRDAPLPTDVAPGAAATVSIASMVAMAMTGLTAGLAMIT